MKTWTINNKEENNKEVCRYCQPEEGQEISLHCEWGDAKAFVESSLLYVRIDDEMDNKFLDTQFTIRYCPMCGRLLETNKKVYTPPKEEVELVSIHPFGKDRYTVTLRLLTLSREGKMVPKPRIGNEHCLCLEMPASDLVKLLQGDQLIIEGAWPFHGTCAE